MLLHIALPVDELVLILINLIWLLIFFAFIGININLFFVSYFIIDQLLQSFDLFKHLVVFFFLNNNFPDCHLSILLLVPEVFFQFCIVLDKLSILVINSLSYRRYEFKIVLHFIFSLFQISFLVPLK